MIGLKEQIFSLIFSFNYGLIISFLYVKFYKYFYYSKKVYCFLNSYLFCFIVILLFFKILYIINDGVINIYFILISILSFIFFNKKFTNKLSI